MRALLVLIAALYVPGAAAATKAERCAKYNE